MAQALKKPRKPRQKAPENETPAERFRRLAKQRIPRAIKALESVAKLGGRGYEYNTEQVNKIGADLTAALKRVQTAFNEPGQQAAASGEYEI